NIGDHRWQIHRARLEGFRTRSNTWRRVRVRDGMSLPLTKIDLAAFDVVVFDVLGTLVDEPAGLRSAIRAAVPTADPPTVDALTARWQQYVAEQQSEIAAGGRSFVDSAVLDAEAAELVLQEAARLGAATDPVAAGHL